MKVVFGLIRSEISMAVGGAIDATKKVEPRRTALTDATDAVGEFVHGAVGGASGKSTAAGIAGDIVGSCIPGLCEAKSLKDVFEGLRGGDVGQIVSGVIGLIPVAGAATKSMTAVGTKVTEQVTKDVAEKGMSVAAANLSRLALANAKKTVGSQAFKKQMTAAGEQAFQRATHLLTEKLEHMASQGKKPDIVTRDHSSFVGARDAAFTEMGARPDRTWQTLRVEDDGKKTVVGKHKPIPLGGGLDDLFSARGFRFIDPEPTPGAKPDDPQTYHLMWWKQEKAESDPTFGIESFRASEQEARQIQDAYLNQDRSFRSQRRSA